MLLKPKWYHSLEEAELRPEKVRSLRLLHSELGTMTGRLRRLVRLEELSFGWCSGVELPEDIRFLAGLRTLKVLNTPIQTIPGWLSDCPRLHRLMVRGTAIAEVPASLGLLTSLEYLELGCNDLRSVPAELGNLRNLRVLSLPDNLLTCLPEDFRNLTRLHLLMLVGNRFSHDEAERIRAWYGRKVVSVHPVASPSH